ncbi:MAG: hypothetical protein JWM74_3359, partial [Myxococcaceae bacterium]|nr:hypothetical protein [Myxococcaceae bacterium]
MSAMDPIGYQQANSEYIQGHTTPESITRTGSSNVVCGLSPDSLMFYCESRLRGIGEQIGRAVAQQQKSNSDISALNELHETLNQYSKGVNAEGTVKGAEGDAAFQQMSAAYDAAISKVGKDTELGKKLIEDKNRILNTNGQGGTDNIVLEHEMKAMTNNLETMVKDINGNSELQMINLQSLMSQRQAAVQLTTNLVQSLGDQMNKIAANIGH